MRIELTVDGTAMSDDVEPRTLLVQYLREQVGLSGVNIGCDTTNCGACTVHLDGTSVKSCTVLACQADGQAVETVHSLAGTADDEATWHPIQQAFHAEHGLQCGYCTPGMMMQAKALLAENPDPSDEEIRDGIEGNLCRCTGYVNIVRAIRSAATAMSGGAAIDLSEGQPTDVTVGDVAEVVA